MSRTNAPTRTVFLDALGTLVELEPPAPRLASLLGVPDDERLQTAVRAEMAYYREHAHEGRDPASLAELRERCASLIATSLGVELSAETLLEAIRFRPFDDAEPSLRGLRERGLGVYCVSNWDCSLPQVLDRVGLRSLLDGVVTSAGAGSRKPDPAIFEAALKLSRCSAEEAVHVGDTVEEDVEGALAAGIRVLLLKRGNDSAEAPPGVVAITSLSQIGHHLRP